MRKRGTSQLMAGIGIGIATLVAVHVIARLIWMATPSKTAMTNDVVSRTFINYDTDAAGHFAYHMVAVAVIAVIAMLITISILKIKQRARVTLRSSYVGPTDTKELRVSKRDSTNAHLN